MFRSSTIIRELVRSLAKVIFMLKHSVKLRRYILCGDVAACHAATSPHNIQGVTGGTDQTSGECSLGQTIPI